MKKKRHQSTCNPLADRGNINLKKVCVMLGPWSHPVWVKIHWSVANTVEQADKSGLLFPFCIYPISLIVSASKHDDLWRAVKTTIQLTAFWWLLLNPGCQCALMPLLQMWEVNLGAARSLPQGLCWDKMALDHMATNLWPRVVLTLWSPSSDTRAGELVHCWGASMKQYCNRGQSPLQFPGR